MPKASIDYLNARREHMHARSGGSFQDWSPSYLPDSELDACERTEAECDSAWSDFRIAQEAYWQRLFERFGILPDGDDVDELPF